MIPNRFDEIAIGNEFFDTNGLDWFIKDSARTAHVFGGSGGSIEFSPGHPVLTELGKDEH